MDYEAVSRPQEERRMMLLKLATACFCGMSIRHLKSEQMICTEEELANPTPELQQKQGLHEGMGEEETRLCAWRIQQDETRTRKTGIRRTGVERSLKHQLAAEGAIVGNVIAAARAKARLLTKGGR